jgi:long-chain acyl-CoA synthetase
MRELTFAQGFGGAMRRWRDKIGFHDGAYRATFGEHEDRVLRLAHALRHDVGLQPGDRVAIMALNSHEYLELYHACFLGGAMVNPLNLRLAGPELQFILADSGTEVVFVDRFFAEHLVRNIAAVRADLPLRTIVLIDGHGGIGELPCDIAYEELIAGSAPIAPPVPGETDPAVLMYTGGTTGLPKGVLLDQRAEILNLYHIGMSLGFDERRVYLHQTPMFHAASMGGVLGIPTTGGTSVFVPMFDPEPVMQAIETHEVDWTMMVPTMIAMTLNAPTFDAHRFRSLRDLVYGASPMPAALLERTTNAFPWVRLWQGYGMTESSSVLTFLSAEDHEVGGPRLRSAGRPVLGVQLAVQDDKGNELAPYEDGEVCVRGGNLMVEYWNRPVDTDEAFRYGWYHTGDEGHLDEEGYLYLVDRVKDMIVTGGENVYSIEVENALSTHPAVDQVAVIGIPHDVWGEQVHAVVVLKPDDSVTSGELTEHARRTIAGYKVPKSFEFRTEPLPLSGALKPLKRALREPYWQDGHKRSA